MGSGNVKEKTAKIPITDSAEDKATRKKLFRGFDVNGNFNLSLAEIDKGIRDVLELPELFDSKPVIMRAYQASKDKVKSPHTFGDDYVSRGEFKYLLIYLKFYYELWVDFQTIDVDGERRLSVKEFTDGVPLLTSEWKLKIPDPHATFEELKKKNNAQANITFT